MTPFSPPPRHTRDDSTTHAPEDYPRDQGDQGASPAPLGIVAALPEEVAALTRQMGDCARTRRVSLGNREYHVGQLWGVECVVSLARIGKVAAAVTATTLIHRFGVRGMLFTGVAGGLARDARVGDVIVADELLQHDMDASPLFPRFEVPLLGLSRLRTDKALTDRLTQAAAAFVADGLGGLAPDVRKRFGLGAPAVRRGLIVSGDRFVSGDAESAALRDALPDALAVEMEGAAIAQVCFEHGVPCAVIRTISDAADDAAHIDFPAFLRQVASVYSFGIVRNFLGG